MPKGVPNKRYTAEFKKHVVETMRNESLSYRETARRFDVPRDRPPAWERIYLEEGRMTQGTVLCVMDLRQISSPVHRPTSTKTHP